ncbi:YkoP family protein [Aneurinibacillus aneurinilyticus]|uniref:YkoP-like domain-containing protein n=2 Tax=Aneurinibacillus aneurinilyticus TaxID=1391 RepID=A0A848CUT4_ANEAE|nr:hypothetical protein [Aneurinibacillus aneurinilyticus]ERI09288.1 hypothetical protein HMPREF0083_02567 [Aneurinibacillus aneurinilyticus ATCC 12856]MCI1694584.1 hypothetical protein [Aneurinibacillus aneurinilyticus]MED0672234.1 hypothetical protein [Aneurinibacillus aneurinilyticus]MED0704658.1 hypothetical protein [Aneurinibacillus aneurinilyticus]MED0724024.1 hypothetical protein [Aneurinibacillus aneurinilyticus]
MSIVIRAWSLLDKFYFYCSRLEYVNQEAKNIFRVKLLKYRGQELFLANGTSIRKNDTLLKIHLHNCMLIGETLNMRNDTKRALYVYKRVEESMPGLVNFIRNHPRKDDIKGVIGITLLHRGVSRLGFEVKDIENSYYRRAKQFYMKPLFLLYHLNKQQRRKKEHMVPKFLVISKERLLGKYLQDA